MYDYESTIGIEVHVQLRTKSKIFCSCLNTVTNEPNSNICPVCTGYPGSLPVLNKEVINKAILAGIATNCSISHLSQFDRKHYFYPDLPKGFQITQGDKPICTNGYVEIKREDGSTKKIRIMRIHIEEDAGKNIHSANSNESFVDLNRAGTPLLEIVTEPDIANSFEAKAYLKALRNIVLYLNISSANMEDGAFRADTNISIKKKSAKELGTRCELKNINSFKYIGDATDYEIQRQVEALESGEKIVQQTRLWDTQKKQTLPMRSKEEAADYRYFQEPDLPLIEVGTELVERIASNMPELPGNKLQRLMNDYGLSEYEADILVDNQAIAQYFEDAITAFKNKQIINWVLRDVLGYLKEEKLTLAEFKVTPEILAQIIELLDTGKINSKAAREVFETIAKSGGNPQDIVKEKGLEQIGSADELEKIVADIIAANPGQVEQFKAGKDRILGFFVGMAMKETKGKGNPKLIQELVKKHLAK
ncbi:Asp-tRNA(Asn)/Glu-tRNA(Gln) amidotransferase subunit GatB [bacterium]|nr:Asp-tRNA(Asn)/Glu-tRNA(Gln) amidotransferase subunit GatB [bacterium]MBT5015038.1 Asp-tRNA(Asn)/Glu-tRNA(Gln) amidotransferase subunit GatB [bacterium]